MQVVLGVGLGACLLSKTDYNLHNKSSVNLTCEDVLRKKISSIYNFPLSPLTVSIYLPTIKISTYFSNYKMQPFIC